MNDELNKCALALRLSGCDVLYAAEGAHDLPWRVACVIGNQEIELNCHSAEEVFDYFIGGHTPREYYVRSRPLDTNPRLEGL